MFHPISGIEISNLQPIFLLCVNENVIAYTQIVFHTVTFFHFNLTRLIECTILHFTFYVYKPPMSVDVKNFDKLIFILLI